MRLGGPFLTPDVCVEFKAKNTWAKNLQISLQKHAGKGGTFIYRPKLVIYWKQKHGWTAEVLSLRPIRRYCRINKYIYIFIGQYHVINFVNQGNIAI